jgi:hypothetical protein
MSMVLMLNLQASNHVSLQVRDDPGPKGDLAPVTSTALRHFLLVGPTGGSDDLKAARMQPVQSKFSIAPIVFLSADGGLLASESLAQGEVAYNED